MVAGRIAVSGRVAVGGRVPVSGRVASTARQGYLFTFGSTLLRAYWRTDQQTLALVNGKVSQWADQSGNNRHVTQASSTKRPTFTAQSSSISTRSAVSFTGSQFLTGAFNALAAITNWTICCVMKSTDNSAARCAIYPSASGGVAITIDAGATLKREIRAVGTGNATDALATTVPEVWIADRDSTTLHLYTGVAGGQQTLDLPTILVSAVGGSLTIIGAITTSPVFGFSGDLYEIAVLSTQLTATQRAAYLAEVSQKYGAI